MHAAAWHAAMPGDRVRALFTRYSVSRDRLPFRLGPSFWRGLGAIVLGAMLANWVWILFAPPVAAVGGPVDRGAPGEADTLFGVPPVSATDAQGPGVLPSVRLAGVYAGTPGFAILELDGTKQVGVMLGAEVVRGVTLTEIAADHVVVEGGGVRQRVDLIAGRPRGPAPAIPGTPPGGAAYSPLPPGVMPPGAIPNGLPSDPREAVRRELSARGQP